MSMTAIINTIRNQQGVTMLEVLIFVTLLSMIFVAVAQSTTQSLKRTQYNQENLIGTRYAEELDEWLSSEKEVSWTTFSSRAASPANYYCFEDELTTCDATDTCWDNTVTSCNDCGYTLDAQYKRCASLETNGSRVDVDIIVEWIDGPNTFSIPLATTFSRWE